MANSSNPSDRWYFTKEQLESTPSRKCGFDSHKELSNRQQAANFIQDMGQRLKVCCGIYLRTRNMRNLDIENCELSIPTIYRQAGVINLLLRSQLCINTAIVYMHRFYVFHSFTHFPWHQMAAAALFLAAKVEEQPRKLEYVIRVANICKNGRDTNIDVNSERYISQSQDLVFNENVLLQTLGFDVAIDHPHTHVVRCCHLVRASKDLAQTSYFMASNSLHLTTMCIQYKPTVVACFCILVACKWSNWEIPLSNEKKEWYSYVDSTVTAELLQQLTEEFLVIFEKCPSRLKEKIMAIADNVNHIPSHHINSPFDTDPKKIVPKEEKDSHLHRSSSGMEDPHKHRSSRVHEMGSSQHQREKERDRNRERLSHQSKSAMSSTGNSSINSGSSTQLKSASHSGHHRPHIDPKMKPPSRPPMPYPPQPKDILREAAAKDSPFGLARDSTREYLKDSLLGRPDKDSNKRDYHNMKNNQNEVNSGNYSDHRLNYNAEKVNYDKQRLDSNGRPRVDSTKISTGSMRRDESKSHLENIKKHLVTNAHEKDSSYLNKSMSTSTHELLKSVPKQSATPVLTPIKLSHPNNYAPPTNSDIKVKQEQVIVKEEVLSPPPVIKRPSLFSPEQTPPQKHTNFSTSASDGALISPLTISPIQIKRERNYSSSSEPELRLVMKKIDQVEGFENIMRDSTIGINKINQSPDFVGKSKTEIKSSNEIKRELAESCGDNASSSTNILKNRSSTVNGLETSDPTVISNLLKEVSSISHLPTMVPPENVTWDQTDKNLNNFHHKSKKKNKDKHKHKDKNREEREKKKKHKDKDREKHKHKDKTAEVPPPIESLKIIIPKDKIIPVESSQPHSQGLKIKIPKNKINTDNFSELSQVAAPSMQQPMGIKLKIPKEMINNCVNLESGIARKRERERGSPEGPPSKTHKSSIKEAKTNGKYSNSNKVSTGTVNTYSLPHTGFLPQPDSSSNFSMFSTPPPPPPPIPPPPAPPSQMYYFNQPPPNLSIHPPSYMYPNPYYPPGYMYQSGMYSHPPPLQTSVMHNSSSIPPLPRDAPPQAPPPPPE